MEKVIYYAIFYRTQSDTRWYFDAMNIDPEVSGLKLAYERKIHPDWTWKLIEIELPA